MLGRVRLFYRREIEGRVGAAICENPYYDAGLIGRSRADPDWENRTGFRISSPEKPLYGTQESSPIPVESRPIWRGPRIWLPRRVRSWPHDALDALAVGIYWTPTLPGTPGQDPSVSQAGGAASLAQFALALRDRQESFRQAEPS
jgi:hypothetical protein